jgi:hypothetical protein
MKAGRKSRIRPTGVSYEAGVKGAENPFRVGWLGRRRMIALPPFTPAPAALSLRKISRTADRAYEA